jgi:hypothetical protein
VADHPSGDQPREGDYDVFYDGPEPESRPEGSAADAVVAALLEAGPEAAEHLLKAAQELLLAAKAVVDAGERVIEHQRGGASAPEPGGADEGAGGSSRVRRIDLA